MDVLQEKGLTSPMLEDIAGRMKTATDNVWIGKDGLVLSLQIRQGLKGT